MSEKIRVLYGGTSEEREVSLRSGEGVINALEQSGYVVEPHDLREDQLPGAWSPDEAVVFPVLHGTFGEDGQLQALLEQAGFEYTGCDSRASGVCFDKIQALKVAEGMGIPTARRMVGENNDDFQVDRIVEEIGFPLILKPACQGSSVGLFRINNEQELAEGLNNRPAGVYLIEEQIVGREFSIGVVEGKALGIVEICPEGGLYDYHHKYTAGATRYLFPAPLSEEQTSQLQRMAEQVYQGCGCRDFARVDFLQRPNGDPVFLEINTLPGMTETSLLPKSASVVGWSYPELVSRMVTPAIERFRKRLADK